VEFERWRPIARRLTDGLARYPEFEELADYHQTLTTELTSKGRDLLLQDQGWDEALVAVLGRAEEHRLELERARAEQERQQRLAAEQAALRGDDAEPAPAKLVVKLLFAVLIAIMVWVPRKRQEVNSGHFAAIVGLTLVNAAVATFW